MKKIIWLMILIPLFMVRVKAATYYGDYGEEKISSEIISENDITKVEEEKYYKWYKNEKVLLDYDLYESDKNFDKNDCYYTEFTEYKLNKPIEHESRFVEEKITYNYRLPLEIRYIKMADFQGNSNSFRMTELQVFIDGVEINYDHSCKNCSYDFEKYIHNGIYNENKSYIINGNSLIIDLGNYYPVNKINIVFYVYEQTEILKTYSISFASDLDYLYAYKYYSLDFQSRNLNDVMRLEHNVNDIDIGQWTYKYSTTNRLDSGYITEDIEKNYRYKELWCRKYEDNIIYSDYKESGSDYELKTEDYITKYRYKKRDKLEIEDNIIIKSKDDEIKNYINSTVDYEISSIDYNKNGKQLININTPFGNFNSEITIDINENKLIDDNENLKEKLDSLNKEYEELNKKNKELIENNLKINEQYETLKKVNEIDITNLNNEKEYYYNLSEVYYDQINELNASINKLNKDVKTVVEHEKELVSYYENELVKNDIKEDVNQELEIKEPEVKKIGYLLKIKENNKVIIIITLTLFIICFIYNLRKKSIKKNN